MATSLPVVCTLDATALRDRTAELQAIGAEALVDARVDGPRALLRFRPTVADRLASVVAAERACCAWLGLNLAQRGDRIALTLAAPPDAEPPMREFAAAFGGPR